MLQREIRRNFQRIERETEILLIEEGGKEKMKRTTDQGR
jgi:hypothetical protein